MQLGSRVGGTKKWMAALAMGAAVTAPLAVHAAEPKDNGPAAVQAEVQKALGGKRFADVKVDVSGDAVTLTGQVDRLADKIEAEKKIHKMHLEAVNDQIRVAVPEGVTDAQLYAKLARALTYDRVGYGTTMFNNIALDVKDGVVTVSGTVYGPADKDSALNLIEYAPGVRGIVDRLAVSPTSLFDDRIRMQEARAIYGFGPLNKYAIDPAKTIRIVVVNGHVQLAGVVNNKTDKELAGIRANGVPGVFSVENDLQVAGQGVDR